MHDSFGTNWRMLEMQAVLGLIQLERMPDWTRRRTDIAEALSETCLKHGLLRVPATPTDVTHAWYRFYAFVRPERLAPGWTRDRIVEAISAAGVPCLHGSASEVYLERAFDDTGWRPLQRLPAARKLGETSICFLTHPTLTPAEVDKTCQVIDMVMTEARR